MDERKDIKSLFLSELQTELKDMNIEKYRAAQIYSWLYKGVDDFADMKNIPSALREKLGEKYYIERLTV